MGRQLGDTLRRQQRPEHPRVHRQVRTGDSHPGSFAADTSEP